MTVQSPSLAVGAPPTELTAELLDACLQAAARTYGPGELAYLALTSGIENPVRDRVAYQLHLRLQKTRLDAGREWNKIDADGENYEPVPRRLDLAVIERPRRRSRYAPDVRGVAEFKAVRTVDAQTEGGLNKIYKLVEVDILKCLAAGGLVLHAIHAVVLLPHMKIVNGRNAAEHVTKDFYKYFRISSRESDAVRDDVASKVAERLEPLGPVRTGMIDGGTEYGMHVTLPYVILGPVNFDTVDALRNGWDLP